MTWFWSLPRLGFGLTTLKDVGQPEVVVPFVEAVMSQGPMWRPEAYSLTFRNGKGRSRRFRTNALGDIQRSLGEEDIIGVDVGRYRFRADELEFRFEFGVLVYHPFPSYLGASAVRAYFEENPGPRLQSFLELARRGYTLAEPELGSIHDARDYTLFLPGQDPKGMEIPISAMYWGTFLGPRLVQRFGRERVFRAPCWRVEALPDGGALLLLSEEPFHPEAAENRALQLAVMDHLGLVEEARALFRARLERRLEGDALSVRRYGRRLARARVHDFSGVPWLRDIEFHCPPEVELVWVTASESAGTDLLS